MAVGLALAEFQANDSESVVARADQALYAAGKRRRHRIVAEQQLPEHRSTEIETR